MRRATMVDHQQAEFGVDYIVWWNASNSMSRLFDRTTLENRSPWNLGGGWNLLIRRCWTAIQWEMFRRRHAVGIWYGINIINLNAPTKWNSLPFPSNHMTNKFLWSCLQDLDHHIILQQCCATNSRVFDRASQSPLVDRYLRGSVGRRLSSQPTTYHGNHFYGD